MSTQTTQVAPNAKAPLRKMLKHLRAALAIADTITEEAVTEDGFDHLFTVKTKTQSAIEESEQVFKAESMNFPKR